MERRRLVITTDQLLYLSIFLWSASDLLAYASFMGDYEAVKVLANLFGRFLLRAVCIGLVLTKQKRYSALLKSIVIIALAEITTHYANSRVFLPLMYVLAIGNDTDDKRIVRTLYLSNVLVFLSVFLSSLVGFLPKMVYYVTTDSYRYTFGFRTSNTGPAILFQIAMAEWFFAKSKKRAMATTAFTFIVSYFFCQSRTASILSLTLFMMEAFVWFAMSHKDGLLSHLTWRIVYGVGLVASLLSIFSVAIATKWVDASAFDELLSGRVFLMQKYFSFYSLTPWGQPIATGTQARAFGLSTLDNSYIYMLLGCGVVLFVLYVYYLVRLIILYKKERNTNRLVTLIFYAAYGFSETVAIRFVYNFSLIFLKDAIWREKEPSGVLNENPLD